MYCSVCQCKSFTKLGAVAGRTLTHNAVRRAENLQKCPFVASTFFSFPFSSGAGRLKSAFVSAQASKWLAHAPSQVVADDALDLGKEGCALLRLRKVHVVQCEPAAGAVLRKVWADRRADGVAAVVTSQKGNVPRRAVGGDAEHALDVCEARHEAVGGGLGVVGSRREVPRAVTAGGEGTVEVALRVWVERARE